DIVLGGNAEFVAKEEMRKQGFTEEQIVESTGHADTEDEDILKARKTYGELYEKAREPILKEAEEVKEAGGLFIIGTERHESRRIDNQLRGRAGRQGDPGESRFYLSLEDDLMRLFGGERVQGMMNSLGVEEDMPIENKMVSNSIESAQKKIEARNFDARKNVLRFDDVMNSQREIIYGQRAQVLSGEDVSESIHNMTEESIRGNVATFCAGEEQDQWDLEALRDHYLGWLTKPEDFRYSDEELDGIGPGQIEEVLLKRAEEIVEKKEEKYGPDTMRELERAVLLRNVDTKWMDHIDAMDELRRGIYLRGYAQRDPVVEYRLEGFDMFDQMVDAIREDTTKMILTVEIRNREEDTKRCVSGCCSPLR
ncbi:preprotein translocase subunit SecA, partial [Ruminococcaceae bacterium OttesenSCG-928-I18]|nr:preprotein translocase subunit SecA [Ruminococcaceae bacterium OttesenSCG-928-I18]